MKILNSHVGRMYIITILLLLITTVISSYILNYIPYNLIISVTTCAVAELFLKKYYIKQKDSKIPFSGIITGFIIGLVAPVSGFIISILIASIAAVISKLFIKIKNVNIFNPAAFGLLVGLGVMLIGDQWWGSISYSIGAFTLPIALIFIVSAYESKRVPTALSFAIIFIIISFIFNADHSIDNLFTSIISINYLFAFLMITEPKTSPYRIYPQILYGAFIALLSYAIAYIGILYPYLIALLVANVIYAVYRRNGNRLMPKKTILHNTHTTIT